MKNKLYKSSINKVFAGVIGGVGEYLDIDPTILRLLYVLIAVLTGVLPAIIGYIIAYIVVPKKPATEHITHSEPVHMAQEEKKEETKKEPDQVVN